MKRKDGTRVKVSDPMYHLIPHFMVHRYDAVNMVTVDVPVAPMKAYINAKRKEGQTISHMAIFLAAYLRTVKDYPALNRFIVNRKIYERNEIKVSLAILKPNGDDTMQKFDLTPDDDVFTIQQKITDFIETNKKDGENNVLDKAMNILTGPMSPITTGAIKLLWWADKHGMLPKWLIDISPFHASVLVSNLASIRAPQIYHHIYDFGTTSMSITMGTPKDVPKNTKDGIKFEKVMPLGFVMDERIANGRYLTGCFTRMKKYMMHPEMLEQSGAEATLQTTAQEPSEDT
ncbi:MAG: hypothetical protein Q4B78_04200 [Bacillota bacterium]|nr:hypothetical protein [Bacillota bacterium]